MTAEATTGQAPAITGQAPAAMTAARATPVAATPPTGQEPAGAPPPEPTTFDLAYVKQLRQEAADWRTKGKALEAKVKATEDAQLSEVDKAKKAATEAVAQAAQAVEALKAEQTARAVETAAFKLGLDPGLASALVTPAMLEYDKETGKPTNVDAVLAALLKKWPQLKPAAPAPAGINATDGRGGTPPANPELRKQELTKRYRIRS